MSLTIWRALGVLMAIGVTVAGAVIVYDFHTGFERFTRIEARRALRGGRSGRAAHPKREEAA